MRYLFLPLAVALLGLGGCASNTQEVATSAAPPPVHAEPVNLTPEQELAKYCRVCVIDNGEKIEEYFPSRLDTQHGGQTYKFCNDNCKKKFDANPKRYVLES